MQKRTHHLIALLSIAILISACSTTTTDQPQSLPSPTSPPPTPTELPSNPPTPSNQELTIWMAPSFAPNTETPAGKLLADHLNAFEAQNPGLTVQVRIKSRTGPGGLLETLAAADAAAPSTMPDLITLDTAALADAAGLGLLVPLDGQVDLPAEPEWYPFVLASLRFDSQTVGMPFASETNILAFRNDLYPSAPRRIETLLAEGHTFQFPAGDPGAEFTLAQYLALEGALTTLDGDAFINPDNLAEVLTFYQAAIEGNVLPLTVRQWTDATQTWSEIQANRAGAAIVPLSTFLQENDPERLNGAPYPTGTETGIALVHTWSWGVVARSGDIDQPQIELLKHLTDPEFLGAWTQALGLVPPNGAALAAWTEGPDSALVSSLVPVARPLPARNIQATAAAAMLEAVEAVLTGVLDPDSAAQAAADALTNP